MQKTMSIGIVSLMGFVSFLPGCGGTDGGSETDERAEPPAPTDPAPAPTEIAPSAPTANTAGSLGPTSPTPTAPAATTPTPTATAPLAPPEAEPADPAAPTSDPPEPVADPTLPAGCDPGLPKPLLDEERTIAVGGTDRVYKVHVPASYTGKPTPLVLNIHGLTSNPDQQASWSNMIPKSDTAGFIVVHPQGIGASWNAGDCCGNAAVDDVGFFRAMLDALGEYLCVDPKRIFATGMSNGGFMSHRLACEMSDKIAAVAPVAGVMGIPTCAPPRPVPVMHFHGTADAMVPYNGGSPSLIPGLPLPGFVFRSVPDTITGWITRDGCNPAPLETFKNGDVTCNSFEGCAPGGDVTLCTVQNGGHTWPGGSVPLAYTSMNINATDAMWDFFVAHPMP